MPQTSVTQNQTQIQSQTQTQTQSIPSEKAVSDQTLRNLLSGSEGVALTDTSLNLSGPNSGLNIGNNSGINSTLSSNGNSNITMVQIPRKQLVTIVPNNETQRANYSNIIKQSLKSSEKNNIGFSTIPDINFGNLANGGSTSVINQQVNPPKFLISKQNVIGTISNPSTVQFSQIQPNGGSLQNSANISTTTVNEGNVSGQNIIIPNGGSQQFIGPGGGSVTTQNISRNIVVSGSNGANGSNGQNVVNGGISGNGGVNGIIIGPNGQVINGGQGGSFTENVRNVQTIRGGDIQLNGNGQNSLGVVNIPNSLNSADFISNGGISPQMVQQVGLQGILNGKKAGLEISSSKKSKSIGF